MSIQIDAEAEPDLGERYGFWGWPALIFLSPQGHHVAFLRDSRPTQVFAEFLSELVENHAHDTLKPMDVEVDLVSAPADGEIQDLVNLADSMIDRFFDPVGNWSGSRMVDGFLIHQAYWRGKQWTQRALDTDNNQLNLLDPEWGGVWFGSRNPDMSGNHIHEKRTEHQAAALSTFARTYQVTGAQKWLDAIQSVLHYLNDFLASPEGLYFTSQEQHVYADNREISPAVYFDLSDPERRNLGTPDIDQTLYNNINTKMVLALSQVFEATGDQVYHDKAVSLMGRIRKLGEVVTGGYRQVLGADQDQTRNRSSLSVGPETLYLRTQAFAGLAALATHQLTAEPEWLIYAHQIKDRMQSELLHRPSGGLKGSNRSIQGPDGQEILDQPLIDAGAAGEFLNRLFSFTYGMAERELSVKAVSIKQFAEDVLRAVG